MQSRCVDNSETGFHFTPRFPVSFSSPSAFAPLVVAIFSTAAIMYDKVRPLAKLAPTAIIAVTSERLVLHLTVARHNASSAQCHALHRHLRSLCMVSQVILSALEQPSTHEAFRLMVHGTSIGSNSRIDGHIGQASISCANHHIFLRSLLDSHELCLRKSALTPRALSNKHTRHALTLISWTARA